MTELKIQIDDALINTYGSTEIEKYLYDFISIFYIKNVIHIDFKIHFFNKKKDPVFRL
jgi:hypothetical protein